MNTIESLIVFGVGVGVIGIIYAIYNFFKKKGGSDEEPREETELPINE